MSENGNLCCVDPLTYFRIPVIHLRMGIDLETWRTKNRLTLTVLAERLGCSVTQARRYCIGEKMPEDDALDTIIAVTGGEVDMYALHLKRQQWRRAQGFKPRIADFQINGNREHHG